MPEAISPLWGRDAPTTAGGTPRYLAAAVTSSMDSLNCRTASRFARRLMTAGGAISRWSPETPRRILAWDRPASRAVRAAAVTRPAKFSSGANGCLAVACRRQTPRRAASRCRGLRRRFSGRAGWRVIARAWRRHCRPVRSRMPAPVSDAANGAARRVRRPARRVSVVGEAVEECSGGNSIHHFFGGDDCAQRSVTAGETFGRDQDVGRNVPVFDWRSFVRCGPCRS